LTYDPYLVRIISLEDKTPNHLSWPACWERDYSTQGSIRKALIKVSEFIDENGGGSRDRGTTIPT